MATAELTARRRGRRVEKIADAGSRGVERIAIGGVMPLEWRRLVDDQEREGFFPEYRARLGAALDADELVCIGKYHHEPRRASLPQLLVGLLRDRLAPFVADGPVAAYLLAGARRGGNDGPQPVDRACGRKGDGAAIGLPGDDDPPVALLARRGDLLDDARDMPPSGVRPAVLPDRVAVELDDVPAARGEALDGGDRGPFVLGQMAVDAMVPDDEAERLFRSLRWIGGVGGLRPIGVHCRRRRPTGQRSGQQDRRDQGSRQQCHPSSSAG